MEEYDRRTAHQASFRNRKALEQSELCGCFFCQKIFPVSEIREWCDASPQELAATAICPYCLVDAVIPDSAGFPLTEEFLRDMRDTWF